MTRALRDIAKEVRTDWTNVYFGAAPYLEAMESLDNITDPYYEDSGKSVVVYFLANAGTWRGPVARRVKTELKTMLRGDA